MQALDWSTRTVRDHALLKREQVKVTVEVPLNSQHI
jgi:hypothetical protein